MVNKKLTENHSQGKGIVYCQNGRMVCLELCLGAVLFCGFSNDPDNMQKLPITFVSDNKPGRNSCSLKCIIEIQSHPEKLEVMFRGKKYPIL